jgi:hypothetical protein
MVSRTPALAQCVLPAIELDCELAARTGEIDDVRPDWVLAAKPVSRQRAQGSPQQSFDFGGVAPQSPRNPRSCSQCHWRASPSPP